MSKDTWAAVESCVRAGADCLALPHLAPEEARPKDAVQLRLSSLGKGSMLVARNFKSDEVGRFISRHIGPDDRIQYRFGDKPVVIREGLSYARQLINEADFPGRF